MEIYGNTRKKIFYFYFFIWKWKYMVKKYFFMKKFLCYQIQFSESAIMNFQDRAAAYGVLDYEISEPARPTLHSSGCHIVAVLGKRELTGK